MPPLETIIDMLGIQDMPVEEQEQVLLKMNELIFRGSIMRMLEQMDQPTRDAFNSLVESEGSEEDLQAFLKKNVPNADQAVADTVAALTSDILAVTSNQ